MFHNQTCIHTQSSRRVTEILVVLGVIENAQLERSIKSVDENSTAESTEQSNKPSPGVVDESLRDFGADEILVLHEVHSVALFLDFGRDCVHCFLLAVADFVAENSDYNSVSSKFCSFQESQHFSFKNSKF